MADILILNELGNTPVATAQSNDPIDGQSLHVTHLDPAALIHIGSEYQIGYDNRTHIHGRTCVAKAGNTATFHL